MINAKSLSRLPRAYMLVLLLVFLSCESMSPQNENEPQTFTWKVVSQPSEDDAAGYRKVYFFDEKAGIALTLTSIDGTASGGTTWRALRDFKDVVLSSFVVLGDEIWVVGSRYIEDEKTANVIFKSDNRGKNWREVIPSKNDSKLSIDVFPAFHDLCFDSNRNLWLAGNGGLLKLEVSDFFARVKKVYRLNTRITRISCRASEIRGLGDEGTIARVLNDELRIKELGPGMSLTKIAFDGQYSWVVGSSSSGGEIGKGILLRSKDGITWESRRIENALSLTDIWFDGKNGWMVGLNGQIFSTSDGGETWSIEKTPTTNNLFSVFFLNSNKGWAVGARGVTLTRENNEIALRNDSK